MNNKEINTLFTIAASFAEHTFIELFNHQLDTSQETTRYVLAALQQAWLTGYAYLRLDQQLNYAIDEVFGFFIESEY